MCWPCPSLIMQQLERVCQLFGCPLMPQAPPGTGVPSTVQRSVNGAPAVVVVPTAV